MRCISSIAISQAETSTRARAVGVALGLQVPDDSAASARKRGKAPETEAYLCTGLDAFVTLEPSPMCAMALLHSRVGRVFYGASDATAGVLGSNGMLHEEKSINHRYRVYRRVLEAECLALLFENPSDAIMAAAADAVKDPDHFDYDRNTKTDPQNKRARLY